MTTFTREQLEEIAAMSSFLMKPAIVCAQVAAFALALLDDVQEQRRVTIKSAEEAHAWRAEKAEAERDRLREELLGAKVAWDMCDTVNRRLREELREAEARALRNRVGGMLEAAEVVRKLRPKEACTCGNYLDFRNGVPGHLPGCLVGECIDAADEIDGRAEEITRGDRE